MNKIYRTVIYDQNQLVVDCTLSSLAVNMFENVDAFFVRMIKHKSRVNHLINACLSDVTRFVVSRTSTDFNQLIATDVLEMVASSVACLLATAAKFNSSGPSFIYCRNVCMLCQRVRKLQLLSNVNFRGNLQMRRNIVYCQ